MASGPIVVESTPHRMNAAYQALIDSGPPSTIGTPTPTQPAKRKRDVQTQPIARPALQPVRRTTQATATQLPGLQLSIHAPPDSSAIAALNSVLQEVQRQENTKRKILSLVARSLDNITASCTGEEKEAAREITDHFTNFLTDCLFPAKGTGNQGKKTWATVVQSGSPQTDPQRTQPDKEAPAKPVEDIRVLARLPEEHLEWAKSLTGFAAREAICKVLSLSLIDIPSINRTATGFAIQPRNKDIRQKILAKGNEVGRCLRATKLELPTKWFNYVVPNCPTKLPNILGELVDTSTVIQDEVTAQTGLRPISIRPSRHGPNPDTDRGSWIVSFLEEAPAFRLFGTSSRARLVQKKPAITRHNPGCQGFHPDRFCARSPRCENCGTPTSGPEEHPQPCDKPPRCANCHGPAPAGHEHCPAKPTRKNGKLKLLTKKELIVVRRTGRKLYSAAHPRDSETQDCGAQTGASEDASPEPTSRHSQESQPNSSATSVAEDHDTAMETDHAEVSNSTSMAQMAQIEAFSQAMPQTPTQNKKRPRRSTTRHDYDYVANRYAFLDEDADPTSDC